MASPAEPQHDDGLDPHDRPPGMPTWVKASAIVVGVVLLVRVAVMLLSGGEHGPMRHLDGAPADVRPAAAAP